jgi:threonine/homoserine/homoserine lactone efflux protein
MLPTSSAALFLLGTVIVLVMPGPTNTLLAAAGLRRGLKRSARLTGAELAGYLMSITLWGFLLGHAAKTLTWLPPLVRIASSVFIAYLAVRMWRTAVAFPSPTQQTVGLRKMFVATLLNPKAILFAGTTFPAASFRSLPAYLEAMAIFTTVLIPIGVAWVAFGAALGSNRLTFIKINPERVQRCASIMLGTFSFLLACSLFR